MRSRVSTRGTFPGRTKRSHAANGAPDRVNHSDLKAKLESGASRVFNCMQIKRDLIDGPAAAAAAGLFFGARSLNNVIFIKEPNVGGHFDPARSNRPLPVRTKIFLPYNQDDPYEGGESVFCDDVKFEAALRHLVGRDGVPPEVFESDLGRIRLLEQLPSLDPFLLKDKFALAGIVVNEAYFRISPDDWRHIRAHIRERFAMMCRFASGGRADDAVVDKLVDRIWEARDLEPLHPLLAALGLPADRGAEFFHAWKGVSYFDYEFARNNDRLRGFSSWIQAVQTRGPAHREDRQSIEVDRAHVRDRMRKIVGETLGILNEYNDSFDRLFRKRETARNFADFMLNSTRHFWTLGNNVNAIHHVLSVWSQATARSFDNSLPPAQLVRLMRTLRDLV